MTWLVVTVLLGAVPHKGATIAVLPLNATQITRETSTLLDEILLTEVHGVGRYEVIGASDLNSILGVERMKDALGCDDASCVSELGGALGAAVVLSSRVGVLGEELVLSSKIVDARKATVLARATVMVTNEPSAYADGVKRMVHELFDGRAAGHRRKSSNVQMNAFLRVGLTREDYLDYANGGMDYWRWAEERNEESVLLEVAKWGLTGGALFFVGMGFLLGSATESTFARNFMVGYGAFVGVGAGATWVVDFMNFGAVPTQIPGVASGLDDGRR